MRAHFTRPVTDQQGNLLTNVQVTVYEAASTTLVADVLYSTDTGNNVLVNPYSSANGVIDLYLDRPKRIRIGVLQGNSPVQYYEDVDVLAAGSDSPHTGAGVNSVVIGVSATSTGNNSTVMGQGANAAGASGTAMGNAASATGAQSVAVGSAAVQGAGGVGVGASSQATGDSSVALGQGATATLGESTALGHVAVAAFAHSTAVGPGAHTTGPNQVMLGTATDVVEIPFGSGLVLSSVTGFRYKITVDDNGSLITTLQ